jgi:hydroxymethylbilane synthase
MVSAETRTVVIGTRASKLALAQAEIVRAALILANPGLQVRLEHITTQGDANQQSPLSRIGGNGLFVTQIEAALRSGQVDLAVHSAKDLPSLLPPDMALAAFLARADPRDVVVSREGARLAELPAGARVGTSSPRRTWLLRAMRPHLEILDIRGNVDTRLRKLREGQYEAIVLAAAGLERLGLIDCVTEWLDPYIFTPAVAQGVLAVEVRSDDKLMLELTTPLNNRDSSIVVRAERAFLSTIAGGCSLPVGAYATLAGDTLHISGMIGSADDRIARADHDGSASDPERVGAALAGKLLKDATVNAQDPHLPLEGKRIVVTRTREQSGGLVARLQALGATPIECPVISIVPLEDTTLLDRAISDLDSYDWVIFTSVNGVQAFAERLAALLVSIERLCARKVGTIGPATRAAVEKLGCQVAFMPDTYVAEAILEQIGNMAGQRVLLPRADIAREALAAGLRQKGAIVDEVASYHTVAGSSVASLLEYLKAGSVDAITFTSSSTVLHTIEGVAAAAHDEDTAIRLLRQTALVCIGPITAATLEEYGLLATAVAKEYTVNGLVDALVQLFTALEQIDA